MFSYIDAVVYIKYETEMSIMQDTLGNEHW